MQMLLLGALCVLIATSPITHVATDAATREAALQSTPAIGASPSGETITIEGKDHPEQIPDHWVWRAAFLKLSVIGQAGQEADLDSVLPLSADDKKALYKEAALQPRRDSDCLHAIQAKQEELRVQQAAPSTTERALEEITMQCRTKDLDAADRVLDALSEDGRSSLLAWIEAKRRSSIMLIPVRDRATFRLPR